MKNLTFSKVSLSIAALALLAVFGLAGCGSEGGGSANTAPTGDAVDGVVSTGGDNFSPDSNLIFVPFSDTRTTQSAPAKIQAAVLATQAGLAVLPPEKWISQHTDNCKDFGSVEKRRPV